MKKYVFIFLALVSVIYISQNLFGSEQGLLQKTIESNKIIYAKCFWTEAQWTGSDTEKYRSSTECWKSKRSNTPNDLYLTLPRGIIDGRSCSISQSEDDHVRPERGWMYATDLACNFKEQGVYAPDYLDDMKEYKIESVWIDNLLGNFVILSFKDNPDIRWYFGHTVLDSGLKVGDVITTWVRFAHANLSWAESSRGTHIELQRSIDDVWQSQRYLTKEKYLANVLSTMPVDKSLQTESDKIVAEVNIKNYLDSLHNKVCDKKSNSPICLDRKLLERLYYITEERIPWKNFFPIMLWIINSESSLGVNFSPNTCGYTNNWWGLKWKKDDNGKSIKDQKIPDNNGCWLYSFKTVEDFWISKTNTFRYGYAKCIDSLTPLACIAPYYVRWDGQPKPQWVSNASIFLD